MFLSTGERQVSSVSLFGRLADELTCDTLPTRHFAAALVNHDRTPLYKHDGYFVFADLGPPGEAFDLTLSARTYQHRTLAGVTTASTMVEITNPGEDEIYLAVTQVQPADDQIRFRPFPFLPPIPAGAAVIGEGTVTTALREPLEGRNVDFAILEGVAGISQDMVLRIIRSSRLIMKPGPYYRFPTDTTLVVVTVVEDDPDETPVSGATLQIDELNDVAPTSVDCGGLAIHVLDLPGPVGTRIVLGPQHRLRFDTDERGVAVFYLPPDQLNLPTAVTIRVAITISKSDYVATPVTIDLTTGERTSIKSILPRA